MVPLVSRSAVWTGEVLGLPEVFKDKEPAYWPKAAGAPVQVQEPGGFQGGGECLSKACCCVVLFPKSSWVALTTKTDRVGSICTILFMQYIWNCYQVHSIEGAAHFLWEQEGDKELLMVWIPQIRSRHPDKLLNGRNRRLRLTLEIVFKAKMLSNKSIQSMYSETGCDTWAF